MSEVTNQIIVVGSSNTDLVVKVDHFPSKGETILGKDFFINPGGKGANQAVAAARLSGNVTLVAKIGNDPFGKQSIENFKSENININHVISCDALPSGVAMICVDGNAENSIIVAPGSNLLLAKADIDIAFANVDPNAIVLIQLEIPLSIVEYTIDLAKQKGLRVILNPAPAQKLSDSLLSGLFAVTPNETEIEILTGMKVVDTHSASKASEYLLNKGVEHVIITLGKRGAYYRSRYGENIIEGRQVKAVDTTAAGDTFNGALAVGLSKGNSFDASIYFANQAAAISVTRPGAQSGMPYLHEI